MKYRIVDELPGQTHPGRAALPRPWLATIQANPKKWVLIEEFDSASSKKAAPRAQAHRLWAKTHKLPVEIASRRLPSNWEDEHAEANPSSEQVGLIFARWMGPQKKKG
jgi:hypothetical protein